MANEGEPGLYKNIEQFLKEKEALWRLSENIPKLLEEAGMPPRGRSFSMIPDDKGEGYSLMLFTFPGNGCQFCSLEQPNILHTHLVVRL